MWKSSTLLLFVTCFLVVYYVLFFYKNRKILKFAWNEKLFFLPILPIVGTSYIILLSVFSTGLPIGIISALSSAKKYIGYPAAIWYGSTYFYITNDASEVKIILNHPKCYDKGVIFESFRHIDWNGTNMIIFAKDEEWKRRRKLFQNAYKPNVLKTFFPTFYKQSCMLNDDLSQIGDNVNLFNVLSDYTFKNFFLTSMGLNDEDFSEDLNQVGTLVISFLGKLASKMLNPFISLYIWTKFFPSGRKLIKEMNEVQRIIPKCLGKRKNHISTAPILTTDDNAVPLFDIILKNVASKHLCEKDIYGETTIFAGAATDTTGNALCFCFTLLGMNPGIQDTLFQEVMDQVSMNEIVNDDLPKLKYTEAVLLEALRLFPSAPMIPRSVGGDVNVGTKIIPKGVNVIIDIFNLHRDEKYWPDPLKFDPTRFLPENASNIVPYSFIPFSAGKRDCLGKGQAMMLMKVTLANVVRKFRIISKHKSIDEFALQSSLTLKTLKPLHCRFSPREK